MPYLIVTLNTDLVRNTDALKLSFTLYGPLSTKRTVFMLHGNWEGVMMVQEQKAHHDAKTQAAGDSMAQSRRAVTFYRCYFRE